MSTPAAIGVVALCVFPVVAGSIVALFRLRRIFSRGRCPSCRGFGSLRTEYGFALRCSDCAGTGSVVDGLPDTVPDAWLSSGV